MIRSVAPGSERWLTFAEQKLAGLSRLRVKLGLPVLSRAYVPASGVLIWVSARRWGDIIHIKAGARPKLWRNGILAGGVFPPQVTRFDIVENNSWEFTPVLDSPHVGASFSSMEGDDYVRPARLPDLERDIRRMARTSDPLALVVLDEFLFKRGPTDDAVPLSPCFDVTDETNLYVTGSSAFQSLTLEDAFEVDGGGFTRSKLPNGEDKPPIRRKLALLGPAIGVTEAEPEGDDEEGEIYVLFRATGLRRAFPPPLDEGAPPADPVGLDVSYIRRSTVYTDGVPEHTDVETFPFRSVAIYVARLRDLCAPEYRDEDDRPVVVPTFLDYYETAGYDLPLPDSILTVSEEATTTTGVHPAQTVVRSRSASTTVTGVTLLSGGRVSLAVSGAYSTSGGSTASLYRVQGIFPLYNASSSDSGSVTTMPKVVVVRPRGDTMVEDASYDASAVTYFRREPQNSFAQRPVAGGFVTPFDDTHVYFDSAVLYAPHTLVPGGAWRPRESREVTGGQTTGEFSLGCGETVWTTAGSTSSRTRTATTYPAGDLTEAPATTRGWPGVDERLYQVDNDEVVANDPDSATDTDEVTFSHAEAVPAPAPPAPTALISVGTSSTSWSDANICPPVLEWSTTTNGYTTTGSVSSDVSDEIDKSPTLPTMRAGQIQLYMSHEDGWCAFVAEVPDEAAWNVARNAYLASTAENRAERKAAFAITMVVRVNNFLDLDFVARYLEVGHHFAIG